MIEGTSSTTDADREASADGALGAVCPHAAVPDIDFDHNSPDLVEPAMWPVYASLREAGRVLHSTAQGGFYVLSHFDDVKAALRDHQAFISGRGHRIPMVGAPRAMPIDYDPPIHTEYRAIMIQAVTPARVTAAEPFLRSTVETLVSGFHERGGGDAVADVTLPLPLAVLTELIGFSAETVSRLRELTDAMWAQVKDTDYDEARRGLRAVVDSEIQRHRDNDLDDYITTLLRAEVGGRPINHDEAARVLITLAIAGHETTMNAAAGLLWMLAKDNELQDRLRADPALAGGYVEEALRLRTPAQNFARTTTSDVEVAGKLIPAGSRVLLSYAAANRDPARFAEPDSFDVSRASRGHMTFGFGIHQCIGATLARVELRILLETLCRYPRIVLTAPPTFLPPAGGIHYGPHTLPLRFES
jgi:cytochrome P450